MTVHRNPVRHNVRAVVAAGLCTQCGACEAVCPHGNVTIRRDSHWRFFPVIHSETCCKQRCRHRCVDICPGIHEDAALWRQDPWVPADFNEWCRGPVKKTWIGHAMDPEVRHRGTSGGLVTGLLVHLLDRGSIDGALVVGPVTHTPTEHHISIARTREEIMAAWGSKYYPMPIGRHFKGLIHANERYAVVLLGCHMRALRLMERHMAALRRSIVLRIGLICGYCSGFKAILDEARAHGITDMARIRRIDYRHGKWPGKVRITTPGTTASTSIYSFLERLPFTTNLRCMYCADLMNTTADISVGDAWLKALTARRDQGWSIVAARTPQAARLVADAADADVLLLRPCGVDDLMRSQEKPLRYKHHALPARYTFVRRFLGKALPDNDFSRYRRDVEMNAWNVMGNWLFLLTQVLFFKRDRLRGLFFKWIPAPFIQWYVRLIFLMMAHPGDVRSLARAVFNRDPMLNCDA